MCHMVASTRIAIRYCRVRGDGFSFDPPLEIKQARGNFGVSVPSCITYESDAVVWGIRPHSGKTFFTSSVNENRKVNFRDIFGRSAL